MHAITGSGDFMCILVVISVQFYSSKIFECLSALVQVFNLALYPDLPMFFNIAREKLKKMEDLGTRLV